MGKWLIGVGYAVGGVNYLLTTFYFFSIGNNFLGLVQLLVPPAEFVLPWVASPVLGVVSLVSLALMISGAALSGTDS